MAAITLNDLSDTRKIGKVLANAILLKQVKGIFLSGALGSGKTALARSIVECMPGFENCEFSSPSYTIFNRYPTRPPVIHCDLYKCRDDFPEEILDGWHRRNEILILEWPEYFPVKDRIEKTLDIDFTVEGKKRYLTINNENFLIAGL